jgi:hypothetical protein
VEDLIRESRASLLVTRCCVDAGCSPAKLMPPHRAVPPSYQHDAGAPNHRHPHGCPGAPGRWALLGWVVTHSGRSKLTPVSVARRAHLSNSRGWDPWDSSGERVRFLL